MIAGAVAANVVARRNREREQSRRIESSNARGQTRNTPESVEADMDTLKAMFPTFEDEVLFLLLQQSQYQIAPTIDMLLTMGGTAEERR